METILLSLFLMLCLGVHRSSPDILKRQKRNWIIDSFGIDEGYKGTYPYRLGKVEIEKAYTFFKIHGQGVDVDPKGILKINEDTGVITVHGPVDFEEFKVLKLTFQALDRENHVVDTQLGIEILVKDANDNPPKFDYSIYEVSIKESTSQGDVVTTIRATDDDSSKNNRLFDFKLISVNPEPQGLMFFLTQVDQTATISFKGCLDHERASKYTIRVEAKDRGEQIQLSSFCTVIVNIEDGNNHLPVITGLTGPGRVKERQENVIVKRLQVTDQDTKGTPAWRAKYQIHGDTNKNFMIKTDPATNEGLLYVEKFLDFEDSPLKKLNISVQNEIAYHACKVVSRRPTGLWEVATSSVTGKESQSTRQVTVIVEDVNEPPFFIPPNKRANVIENVKAGHYLETFTAEDPDDANTFVYRKGDDPADWMTVDAKTGKITTSKIIDRESSFVKDNVYRTTILAVDNGQPPMTGTGTLDIHITDENDNAPFLPVSIIDMCQSDGRSMTNITALDLDENPYGGPFTFKLLGDVKDKWKLDPRQGYSVNLVKEPTVHSGHYELMLEVLDLQGTRTAQNLTVTVCNCKDPVKPNCRVRKASGAALGGAAIGILFFGMLLLAGLLLLALLLSCKKKKIAIPDGDSGQHLMNSNIEKPGTDCKVAPELLNNEYSRNEKKTLQSSMVKQSKDVATLNVQSGYTMSQTETLKQQNNYLNRLVSDSTMVQNFTRGNSTRWSMGSSLATRTRNQLRSSLRGTGTGHRRYSLDLESCVSQRSALLKVLNKVLYAYEAPGEELGDYPPHVYAEEGDSKTNINLDAISISDVSFDPDMDLDYKFNNLASVCMPRYSTSSSLKTRGIDSDPSGHPSWNTSY